MAHLVFLATSFVESQPTAGAIVIVSPLSPAHCRDVDVGTNAGY